MAAVLACGDGAGLSHVMGAVHTGLVRASPVLIDVTVPRRGGQGNRAGIRIHRSKTLRPDRDIELVYGVPTTTVARILLDLLGIWPIERVEDVMDEAGRQDILIMPEVYEQIDRNQGRPEAARLATLVSARDYINSLTETQLEKLFFTGLRAAGLPLPVPQFWIDPRDGGRQIRADFCYVDEHLILETDGWWAHAGRFESDTKRDQRAAAIGFRTLRITRRQVVRELDRVVATVAIVYAECRAAAVAAGRLAA
jgi:hypothetical protein